MQLEGEVVVFIRLEGESPVTVFQDDASQISNVRVLPVGTNTDIPEVVGANLTEANMFDGIVAFNDAPDALAADLEALVPHIKPGGDLQLYVADVTNDNKSAVLMALMISGFVDTKEDPEVTEYPGLANATLFTSKKQQTAAAAPLASIPTAPTKKWTVVADDFDETADEDMIDEDSLLDDTDEVLKAAKDDCEVGKDGKRRACKDCTCGRKDAEDKPVVSESELTEMVSSCGNCYKGDAFRCGSCPFLGKPAFKPGMEKVLLNLDDADDI